MNASEAQTGQKRIEDLTLRELDMVYSLVRIGETGRTRKSAESTSYRWMMCTRSSTTIRSYGKRL